MPAIGIMLGLAGLIVLIAALAQAAQNRSYAACSKDVTGTVAGKRSHRTKRGTAYELTVAYTVDGVAFERVVGALPSEYEGISAGDRIDLRYKPDDPKKVVRPMQLRPQNVRILLIVAAALIAAGAALFLIGQR